MISSRIPSGHPSADVVRLRVQRQMNELEFWIRNRRRQKRSRSLCQSKHDAGQKGSSQYRRPNVARESTPVHLSSVKAVIVKRSAFRRLRVNLHGDIVRARSVGSPADLTSSLECVRFRSTATPRHLHVVKVMRAAVPGRVIPATAYSV